MVPGLENDLYVRQIDGYLPTAEVAFVDEIFKVGIERQDSGMLQSPLFVYYCYYSGPKPLKREGRRAFSRYYSKPKCLPYEFTHGETILGVLGLCNPAPMF